MTDIPPVTIRRADWHDPADRARLETIRRAVFIVEQQVPEALEWDDDDASATHLLAIDPASGDAVGTARILPNGKIGRMAVLRRWRGLGIGRALLREAIARSSQRPFLHAQVQAIDFYRAEGFIPTGEPFDEAGIPHQSMIMADDAGQDAR